MKKNLNKLQNSKSAKIVVALLMATIFLAVTHLILQYLNLVTYGEQYGPLYELTNRFDFDDELSVPTWYAQALFLVISALAFINAKLEIKKPTRNLWYLISAGGLLFSIDEVSGLHEFVLQNIHNYYFRDEAPTALANAWLVILPFVLLVSVWLIYKMIRLFDKKTTFLFAIAIFIFLIGAVGVDQLASYSTKSSFYTQGILVAIEEMFEIISSIIVVYAIADNLETNHTNKISEALKHLRS